MLPASTAARPEPNTFEYVEYYALRYPQRLAAVEGRQRFSYSQLYEYAIRFTRALAAAGVRRGQRVALSQPAFVTELAIVLACENIGAATASFQTEGDTEAPTLFGLVDWVVSELPQPQARPGSLIRLDAAFAKMLRATDVRDGQGHPRVSMERHEPQRLVRSSGSTGRSKWMVLDRKAQEGRAERVLRESHTFSRDSLMLVCQPFAFNGALTKSLGCLRLGAAIAYVRGDELQGLRPTNFHGLPAALERFLGQLPPGHVFHPPVTVAVVGGFMAKPLRERAAAVLRGPLINPYSSNETGNISAELDADGEGWLAPGVEVRILDDEGRDLPPGQPGAIAMRTPIMASAYLDNPQATAAAFRDGWYFSGDAGALVAPRRLRLLGRRDDLVVIGGLKMPAREIEDRVCAVLGAPQAAVTGLHGVGSFEIGIAVVPPPGADCRAALERLARELAMPAPVSTSVIFVSALPRTAVGKVDRVALGKLFAPRG